MAQRTKYDVIPPENFQRFMLDRHIHLVSSGFIEAFGERGSLVSVAADKHQQLGHVALLDIGGGTGNTAYTWRKRVIQRTKCDPAEVEATVVSRHDYSRESLSADTIEAIANGSIRYLLSEAPKLRGLERRSADVILSHHAAIHSTRPQLWLQSMLEIARPGASILFNYSDTEHHSQSPIFEALCELEDQGYTNVIAPVNLAPDGDEPYVTVFCRLDVPAEI